MAALTDLAITTRLRALHRRDVRRVGKTAAPRSRQWPAVERAHLRAQPACAACGARLHLQVHHIKPFHLFPQLELDPKNLITLCEPPGPGGHHLAIGHLGAWKKFNPRVVADAAAALAATP